MYTLMNIDLPEPSGRLRIPIVVTDSKVRSEEDNRTSLEEFIGDCCYEAPGVLTLFKDFFDAFYESLTANEKSEWTKAKVLKGLPSRFPTGLAEGNKKSIANLSLEKVTISPDTKPLIYANDQFITKE